MRYLYWLSLAFVFSSACRPDSEALDSGDRSLNVVLVTIDTLRADRLGAYGYAEARTPNLDRLAREGVLFEQVVSQVPVTLPSHASLMTGLVPPVHGVRDNTFFRLDERAETLAEVLRAQRYRTAAFVGAYVLDRQFGLAQGFDVYDQLEGERRGGGDIAGTYSERRGEEVVDAFTAWLADASRDSAEPESQPFFAWLHLFDPHLPYSPPSPYPQSYDGEIAYIDAQIGRLRVALEDAGLLDDTLFLVTADHGESLGEHGEKSHGFFVYDATLRVPWILRAPGLVEPGRRVKDQVSLIDVAPTLLGALGAPVPASVQGNDVLAAATIPRAAYAECYVSQLNFHWAPLLALREDGFKYIDAPKAELYDLASDPEETTNLLESDPDRARAMRAKLAELISDLGDPLSARLQPDPLTVERLQALGYTAAAPSSGNAATALADPKDRLHLWRLMEEVILHKANGELDRAAEGAQAVLREDPTNLLALELLAGVRVSAGDVTEAITLYDRMLAIDEGRPSTQVDQGELLLRAGDPARAEARFRRALELDPDLVRARLRLGELELATDRPEEALDTFEAVAATRPDDVEARLGVARSLRATGAGARALETLSSLSREHPEHPGVLSEYAGTLARAGRMPEAVSLLQNGPDHHDVHYTLSLLYRATDRMDDSLSELDRALALEPDSAVALHDRGVLLSRLGRMDEAVASLERAIAVRDVPSTRNALGTALCRMDRCAEGIVHFERAVEEAPAFSDALENLAMAYQVVGRAADAARIEERLRALPRPP